MSKHQSNTKDFNIFNIKPIAQTCYYPAVEVDFTAPVNLRKPTQINVPVYFKDKRSFTPAFMLPGDMTYYQDNYKYERNKFEGRVLKALELHQELERSQREEEEIPSIRPSSTYCQICKISFINYHEHISSEVHQNEIKLKIGNGYISQLCMKVQGELNSLRGSPKQKKIKKPNNKKSENSRKKDQKNSLKKRKSQTRMKATNNPSIQTNCSVGNDY